MKNIILSRSFRSAAFWLLALATQTPLLASAIYRMPFENGSSSSLQNFGSAGGTATAVASPYGIGPAPTASSAQARSSEWSLFCTPNSANSVYAGTLLLPDSASRFRMDGSSSKMTVGAWVRWSGTFGGNNRYGIVSTLNTSHSAGWALYIDNTGKVGYRFNIPAGGGSVAARERATTNAVMTPNQWTHVAATVDCAVSGSAAIKFFINGVEQATTGSGLTSIVHVPAPGLEVGAGSFTRTAGGGGHMSLHGYLDDLQMWDKILSAAKVRALYQAPALLPNHDPAGMDALFSAFDSQGSVTVGDLNWSYLPAGLNVSGRTIGDVWKGPGGQYFTWLGGTAQNPIGMVGSPKRTNFAHYMGCWPVGHGALPYETTSMSRYLDPASTSLEYAMGGRYINHPLMPISQTLTPITLAQSAELEIKRAIRAGFDGFSIDAWAGGDGAKTVLNALFTAAEQMGVDFKLTICMDPSCHTTPADGVMVQEFVNTINWLITNHGDSPNLARRHGKVLIFGYQSFNILKNHPLKSVTGGYANPTYWTDISNAWNQVRSQVSEPLFLHADIETMIERAPASDVAIAQWAGQNFDAVGGFVATWTPEKSAAYASAAKAGGAEWSQPVGAHYYSRGGGYKIEPGASLLRNRYTIARDTGTTLIQVATWNDYGEHSNIAPNYSSNYTVMNHNRYQSDWWKAGSAPAVTSDQVHLTFRRALEGKVPWPFGFRRPLYHNVNFLEVTTMLTAAGTVNVPGYGSYQAPAGYHFQQFPLQTGSVSASVTRSGATVVSVTAPEKVTDRPFREDHSMACFSSNFQSEWTADFGAEPPLLYSEYGDIDSDGLPNWFEMYYFGDGVADYGEVGWRGDLPLMNTASSADARAAATADPDGDGFTNLQEFTNQTDPKVADVPYPMGYIWDTTGIETRRLSFNGDQDSHRRNVWFYLFRNGVEDAIPQDGNYKFMTGSGSASMHQYSPTYDPDGLTYNGGSHFGSEIARRQVGTVWQTLLQPRDNAAAILCWKSPVTGLVALSFEVVEVSTPPPPAYHRPFVIDIKRNVETTALATVSLMPGQTGTLTPLSISVQKGDSIYLFGHSGGPYGGSRGYLKNIKVELLQNTGP